MARPPTPPIQRAAQTLSWLRRPAQFMRACQRRYGRSFRVRLAGMDLLPEQPVEPAA